MGARVHLAVGTALLLAATMALVGCVGTPPPRKQAKVDLPSPWATIKAAEGRAADNIAQDCSLRP